MQHISGDILENLGVRISDPWETSAPKKFFEILFKLKTSKNDHSRGGQIYKCPCLQVNVPIYFPKMPFYFLNCPFYFQELSSYFPKVPFCLMELPFCSPEAPFYFSKMSYCFPELPLVFQKCLCFIYYAHLFPRILFFPADSTFSSCSKLLQEIFALLLLCFLLKLFIGQLKIPSW